MPYTRRIERPDGEMVDVELPTQADQMALDLGSIKTNTGYICFLLMAIFGALMFR